MSAHIVRVEASAVRSGEHGAPRTMAEPNAVVHSCEYSEEEGLTRAVFSIETPVEIPANASEAEIDGIIRDRLKYIEPVYWTIDTPKFSVRATSAPEQH